MKTLSHIFIFILLLFNFVYSQKLNNNTFHPYSGSVVFSAEFGASYPSTDFVLPELGILGRIMVEYYFPSKSIHAFGLRVLGGKGHITSEGGEYVHENNKQNFKTKLIFIGSGVTYAVKVGYGVPYLTAMVSYLRFDPRDRTGIYLTNNLRGVYELNAFIYTGEIGMRFPIKENWSFNIGGNINFSNIDYFDDVKKGVGNDYYMSAFFGVSYYLGAQKDSDNDGIEESEDLCPLTPRGITVDPYGCPLDSDNDGVPDYLDDCRYTPQNISVDNNGCPMDSDGDSIPDYLDKCANTPQNIIVDESGCPLDSDQDGIPDYIDKCQNTPRYTKVDLNGCPKEIISAKTNQATSDNELVPSLNHEYDYRNDKLLDDAFFTDGKLYGFQLHSFKEREDALKAVNKLVEKGFQAFIVKAKPFADKIVMYRVRIGFFLSLESAKSYKSKHF